MRAMPRPAGPKVAKPPMKPKAPPRNPAWATEGARFAAVLEARGIRKSDFAEQIDALYRHVHRWTLGFEFTPDKQARAARGLGLADDAFSEPDAAEQREAETRAVLAQFEREKAIASSLSPSDWRVLRSIRFFDSNLRPSVAFYEAVAYALKGAIRIDEIVSVARENAELDRTLSDKPPLKLR